MLLPLPFVMGFEIKMPALSPTMEFGKIVNWLKKENDLVKPGDVVLEVETDKAIMEVDLPFKGTIGKILIKDGTPNVAVGTTIGYLLFEGENASDIDQLINNNKNTNTNINTNTITNNTPSNSISSKKDLPDNTILMESKQKQEEVNQRIKISPLAKNIALQNNIDYSVLQGSGPNGRIVKNDILNELNTSENNNRKDAKVARKGKESKELPISPMRMAIANRLTESKTTAPHFYVSIDVVMDEMIRLKDLFNNKYSDRNIKISINDLFIKVIAEGLKLNPKVNRSWQKDKILEYSNIDICVAVAIEDGLITPIVKNADQKNLLDISTEIKDFAQRAKVNKLLPHEYQGGSITVSNMGSFGISKFQAIINPPQSCIVAIGSAEKKPIVAADDRIQIKSVCNLTISADHRVLDGKDIALFANDIKKISENPFLIFV